MLKVLVVDDDADLKLTVSSALSETHPLVEQARDGEEAIGRVRAGRYDLVLLDLKMSGMTGITGMTGMDALREIKAHDPSIITLLLAASSGLSEAVEATREGAYSYLEKPIRAENLVYLLEKALKARHLIREMTLLAPVFRLPGATELIERSSGMKSVFGAIGRLARAENPVLIRGESGTGKALVAQALHFNGPRKDERFVTISCSAIPDSLIEIEFFGHEKGAFTGADSRKIGKLQYADGGTLFLDEIGDISPGMQVKLLRALRERRFTPVGANREVEVNVRIVAATNRNLEEMIREGGFHEDLFLQLNSMPIHLPPLRERRGDIPALASHFIEKFNQKHHKNIAGLSPTSLELLLAHSWPGNIRELEKVIEHAFVIETGNQIGVRSLPEPLTARSTDTDGREVDAEPAGAPIVNTTPGNWVDGRGFTLDINRLDFQANKEEFERCFLVSALRAFRGRINQTALHANIPKKTLLRKLAKYGIIARDYS